MTPPAPDGLRALLEKHHVNKWAFDRTEFRRKARLLAALWREEHGWPMGVNVDGTPLGSRLKLPEAEQHGWNLLTPAVRRVAEESLAQARHAGALMKVDRLYGDLLSSQPMCFNLFGELAADLNVATEFAHRVWPGRVGRVLEVRFEYSPGRGDPRYLDNGTAFDVFIRHTVPTGGEGFIGIETKYHEDMRDPVPAQRKDRYVEVANASGVFGQVPVDTLWQRGTWQVWLDHMLGAAMMLAEPLRWCSALTVLVYPAGNQDVTGAVGTYTGLLKPAALGHALGPMPQFETRTLEELGAAAQALRCPWAADFHRRYLDWSRLTMAAVAAGGATAGGGVR